MKKLVVSNHGNCNMVFDLDESEEVDVANTLLFASTNSASIRIAFNSRRVLIIPRQSVEHCVFMMYEDGSVKEAVK